MGLPCKDSHLNLCYCADIWRLYSELSLLWLFVPFEKLRKVEILHLTHSPPPTFNSFAFMLYNPITSEGNAYCHLSATTQTNPLTHHAMYPCIPILAFNFQLLYRIIKNAICISLYLVPLVTFFTL